MVASRLIDRRQLLSLASGSAAGLCLPRGAWSQPRLGDNPFALGVASGSPEHDSVVLWTRLMAGPATSVAAEIGPVTVLWEVADDDKFRTIVRTGQATAAPELAHSVHAEVAGLAPARWYFYRFRVGDAVSPVGRTRTLPAPDAVTPHFRIAYASCQKWEDGYFSAWRHMLAEDIDLVLFLGDYIYEYPGVASRVRQPTGGWVISLQDYRRRHALYKSDPDLQANHAALPWSMTWDDHEVQNDYAGLQAGNGGPLDPSLAAQHSARRAAAYQAYYEHMPIRSTALARSLDAIGSPNSMRIYSQLRVGRLLSIYLLDGRQYRDPQVCTRDGNLGSSPVNPARCPRWHDAGRTMLGWEQERWLDRDLAMPATQQRNWTVIGQQTVFGQRDFRLGPGASFSNDGWDGYSAARTRLTESLQRHQAPNPVLIGGDVHANWVGHVKADYTSPRSQAVGVEFCGTSITSKTGDHQTPERLAENPHFVFADARHRGYAVAEFTPVQLQVELRALDDVTRPEARISRLASFAVQAGRPVVHTV